MDSPISRRHLVATIAASGITGSIGIKSYNEGWLDPYLPEGFKKTPPPNLQQPSDDNNGGAGTETPEGTETPTPTETPNNQEQEDNSSSLINFQRERNTELRTSTREYMSNEEFTQYFSENNRKDSRLYDRERPESATEVPIDLTALEWWHDNDFHAFLGEYGGSKPEMKKFVDSIGDDSHQTAKTSDYAQDFPEGDQFSLQKLQDASTGAEALDWLQPYLFKFEWEHDRGSFSGEDEKFAAVYQESFDQYTDLETHFWGFDLPEAPRSTHGSMMMHDAATDTLRIVEPISKKDIGTQSTYQGHVKPENSTYLEEGNPHQNFWHPLLFNGTPPKDEDINREGSDLRLKHGKHRATSMFTNMSTGGDKDEKDGILDTATTTRYLTSVAEAMRTFNDNDISFDWIKDQAKAYQKLSNSEGVHAVGGTVHNPVYTELDSQETADEIWEDQEGTLTDYVEDPEVEKALEPGSNQSQQSLRETSQVLETA